MMLGIKDAFDIDGWKWWDPVVDIGKEMGQGIAFGLILGLATGFCVKGKSLKCKGIISLLSTVACVLILAKNFDLQFAHQIAIMTLGYVQRNV